MARVKIIDYIWKSENLEGIQITFVKTQDLFYGIGVEGVSVRDIIKINNLKIAW